MFNSQLFKLFTAFYKKYPFLITTIIALSITSHTIDTVLIPILLAEIFTSIDDKVKLKSNVIYFLLVYIFSKGMDLLAIFLDGLIEPYLTNFLTREFARLVFIKHDIDNKPVEVAMVTDKIKGIRKALENFLSYLVSTFIPIIVTLLLAIIRITTLSYKLAGLVLVLFIGMSVVLILLPQPKAVEIYRDNVSVTMEDLFQNIEYITSTQFGDKQANQLIGHVRNMLKEKKLNQHRQTALNQTIAYIIASLIYVACVMYLYHLFKNDEINVKGFESLILMIGRMFEMIFMMAHYLPEFITDYQTLFVLEDFTSELFSYQEKTLMNDTNVEGGDIEFNNVSFKYDSTYILENFSITIKTGQSVALYGRSGTGKSSFTKLIMDIYQPYDGCIKIGNTDMVNISKQNLRCYISYIAQNTASLLQMTIYNNIIFGFDDSTELRERVITIIDKYKLDTIFDENFLDTKVEKAGSTLSGGQKQIIHLIHCIINEKSKIIILDEPTSSLDHTTKECVYTIINDLVKNGKTILIITHDEDLKNRCNKTIKFEKGKNPTY